MALAHVLISDLPAGVAKRYPRQIPVTRLGRLAIRVDMQSQGLGRLLLADAINRAQGAAQAVGTVPASSWTPRVTEPRNSTKPSDSNPVRISC